MTVYNFNRGIGWASSGVEYAQSYRATAFRAIGVDARFVFTDLFRQENIEHMTAAIGFKDCEVIWLYMFFTDFHIAPTTYTRQQLESEWSDTNYSITEKNNEIRYDFPGRNMYIRAITTRGSNGCIQHTEIVSEGKLIRKDYYSYGRMFSEFYAPKDGHAVEYARHYFNEDGSTAYMEIVSENNSIFRFPDRILYSKEQLICYMIERLQLTDRDVVILDRFQEIGAAVHRNIRPARFGIVVHAEHYNEVSTDDHNILWNNHYEYDFTHTDSIDFIITSTDLQTHVLKEQLEKYYGERPDIRTIPVGSLKTLKVPDVRRRHSFITASRLAAEKHIDWLVKAAVLVHDEYPDLIFDIYGKGTAEDNLKELIDKNNAGEYIRLQGHHDLTDVYKEYTAYASASTSEGFGLTLMEAVGSGLIMMGYDVHYGNNTFIEDEKNGVLIPFDHDMTDDEKILGLAKAMSRICSLDNDMESAWHEASYSIAREFLSQEIENRWRSVLEGAD